MYTCANVMALELQSRIYSNTSNMKTMKQSTPVFTPNFIDLCSNARYSTLSKWSVESDLWRFSFASWMNFESAIADFICIMSIPPCDSQIGRNIAQYGNDDNLFVHLAAPKPAAIEKPTVRMSQQNVRG
mmetsp:Transcript_2019/g.4429  ORF Transcript_2019/g.4429 Transcript_2019/m.4429 type:complete len:129 (-) Transcript_2019:614-1000(-)